MQGGTVAVTGVAGSRASGPGPHASGPERPAPIADVGRDGLLLQLAIAALAVTAALAARPFVTYRAVDLGADAVGIGLIQSAFSIMPVVTAVSLGRLVDRGRESTYLIAAMGLILAGCVIVAVAGSLILLALGLTVMGFGMVVYLVAGQAMIANIGAAARREHRVAWWSTATSIGQFAGPAGAAVLVSQWSATSPDGPPDGNHQLPVFAFAVVVAAIGLGLAFLLARWVPEPAGHATARPPREGTLRATLTIIRRPGMLGAMVVSIAVMAVSDILVAYLPAFGAARGLSDETVGVLLATRAAASLVVRLFMGPLVGRFGSARTLVVSMSAAGLALLLVPLLDSEASLLVLMAIVGLGLGLGQPMTITWIVGRSHRAERATSLAVRVMGNRAALLLIPSVMGALAGSAGLAAIFVAMAVGMGGSALIAATSFGDPRPDD